MTRTAIVALALSLAGPAFGHVPAVVCVAQEAEQASPARKPGVDLTPEELRRMSVRELLERMPVAWQDECGDPALRVTVEELRRRAEAGLFSDEDWRAALLAAHVMHTRRTWLQNTPLLLWVREPVWLRRSRITVRATTPDLGEVVVDSTFAGWCASPQIDWRNERRSLALRALPAGTTRVVVDLLVEQASDPASCPKDDESMRVLWRGSLELPVKAVADLEAVLPMSRSAEQTQAVRDSLRAAWHAQKGALNPTLSISAGGSPRHYPALQDVGLSLDVELWYAGKRICRSALLSNVRMGQLDGHAGLQGWCTLRNLPTGLTAPDNDVSGCEVRVRGTSDRLDGVWEAESWWSGELTVPLSELLARPKPR